MSEVAEWFGDRAVLVCFADGERRAEVAARLAPALPGYQIRAGMDSVLVEAVDPAPGLLDDVRAALSRLGVIDAESGRSTMRDVVISVRYDGVDLADVAATLGCSVPYLVEAHRAQEWRVAFLGFAPGFGYLEPVGEAVADWHAVPRRGLPRSRVSAGSVALAAGCSAIYPEAMPGGWNLIGTSEAVLFSVSDPADPTLLHAGDRVRFVALPAGAA